MEKVKRRFKETTKGVKGQEFNYFFQSAEIDNSLSGCPNKWNVHHVCTVFCLERWGEGHVKPTKIYRERYNRLIDRYAIPKNWVNVWDPGCEAFYFWNKTTGESDRFQSMKLLTNSTFRRRFMAAAQSSQSGYRQVGGNVEKRKGATGSRDGRSNAAARKSPKITRTGRALPTTSSDAEKDKVS